MHPLVPMPEGALNGGGWSGQIKEESKHAPYSMERSVSCKKCEHFSEIHQFPQFRSSGNCLTCSRKSALKAGFASDAPRFRIFLPQSINSHILGPVGIALRAPGSPHLRPALLQMLHVFASSYRKASIPTT